MIETKKGESRYDGKKLTNVPKIHELPPEVCTGYPHLIGPRHCR